MLFNSSEFVVFFLLVLCVYWALPRRSQNVVLLIGSYVFYGWWDWRFLSLIFASTIVNYTCGILIHESKSPGLRKLYLCLTVLVSLSLLGIFKYYNFFAENLASILSVAGLKCTPSLTNIVLPAGISFYTFQTMSYSIDIYRREMIPTRSLLDFAVFVAFFPQLVAGPIERAKNLLPQITQERRIEIRAIKEGIWLVLLGYYKKVVVADNLAYVAEGVFDSVGTYGIFGVTLGILAFAFEIYCDFSGYSDIARGVARFFGINLMVNFRMPYFSSNPAEFWSRWHISLSSWLRDYLYIPLGGNRHGRWKTYRNILITMVLGGLWHGAAWTYVLWGVYQGLLLVGYRAFQSLSETTLGKGRSAGRGLLSIFKMPLFFLLICGGWVLFRANSVSDIVGLVHSCRFLGPVNLPWMVVFAATVIPLLGIDLYGEVMKNDMAIAYSRRTVRMLVYAYLYTAILVMGEFNEKRFIYFQF